MYMPLRAAENSKKSDIKVNYIYEWLLGTNYLKLKLALSARQRLRGEIRMQIVP